MDVLVVAQLLGGSSQGSVEVGIFYYPEYPTRLELFRE
jgi:hypothetical protein